MSSPELKCLAWMAVVVQFPFAVSAVDTTDASSELARFYATIDDFTVEPGPAPHRIIGTRHQGSCSRDEVTVYPPAFNLGKDPYLHIPKLKKHDKVAVFGAIFQLTSIDNRGVRFERVADKAFDDLRPDADSIACPLHGYNKVHNTFARVQSIKIEKARGEMQPVARLSLGHQLDTGAIVRSRVDVTKGDIFTMGMHQIRVRKVVPRDETAGIIGWVEIDPKPIP